MYLVFLMSEFWSRKWMLCPNCWHSWSGKGGKNHPCVAWQRSWHGSKGDFRAWYSNPSWAKQKISDLDTHAEVVNPCENSKWSHFSRIFAWTVTHLLPNLVWHLCKSHIKMHEKVFFSSKDFCEDFNRCPKSWNWPKSRKTPKKAEKPAIQSRKIAENDNRYF